MRKLRSTLFLLFVATFSMAQKGKGLVLELCNPDSFEQREILIQLKGASNLDTFMGKDQLSLRLHALDTGRYWLCVHAPNKPMHLRELKVYEAYYAKTYINLYEKDSTEIVPEGEHLRFLNQFGTCHTGKQLSLKVINAETYDLLNITLQLLQADTLEYGTFILYDGASSTSSRDYGDYQMLLSHIGAHSVSQAVSHVMGAASHFEMEMQPKIFVLDPYIEIDDPSSEPFFGPYGQDGPRKSRIYREMPSKVFR